MTWNVVKVMSDAKFYNDYARYREEDNRYETLEEGY